MSFFIFIAYACIGIFILSLFSFSYILEFSPLSFPVSMLDFMFELDLVSLSIILMLFVCGSLVCLYCFHYFFLSLDGILLYLLIVWFIGVMGFLCLSSSLVLSLVFWEYLGIVSFLLILFYSNSTSLRASLVTLFSSRFGDVALFCVICWFFISGGIYDFLFVFLFLLIIVTKSASFPFISWLLEAMRAPTPVSSLVHSSTLVAAGVWFICRYGYLFSFDSFSGGLFFIISILTIVITGVCALCFIDLKKIVALSTCNNIAWCMIFLMFGELNLVLFQLVSHGVSKCMLFMLVGDIMMSSSGGQLSSGVYMSGYSGVYNVCLLSFLIFSLCGLPFIGVFFTKHFFLVNLVLDSFSILVLIFVFLGFFLSYSYSFRFVLLICDKVSGMVSSNMSSYIFICFSIMLGSFYNYLFVNDLGELGSCGFLLSLFFIFLMLSGLIFGWSFFFFGSRGGFWYSILWGMDGLVGFFYSVFNSLYLFSLCSFYRWEVFLLSCIVPDVSYSRYITGCHFFSLNFIIMGLIFCFVSFFYFC